MTNPLQPIIDSTFQKIEEIEQLMLARDPMLAGHLQSIHKSLAPYEELVHLLSDEQIKKLIAGQMQVTGTVLTQAIAKSTKTSVTKQAKNLSVDDL